MTLVFWHWWVLALSLLVLEVLAPGTFFLWMGLSAGVVGLLAFVLPAMPVQMEMVLFGVFSLAAIGLWWKYREGHPLVEASPHLNERGSQYVGQTLTLSRAIENGVGRAMVGDTHWRVTGPDLPIGSRVVVVSVDGATLQVRPA